MIEEVKEILINSVANYTLGDKPYPKEEMLSAIMPDIDNVALKICQLFPKSLANPDGYEPKPIPDELLLTEDDILYLVTDYDIVRKPFGAGLRIAKAQLAKALPAREELDKLREQIKSLNTKLDDREIDLLEAKRAGMKEGIWLFAWWKDGVQYVGTSDRTLKDALKELGIE